ncbi:MAG: DNA mismatch repair protein MutS [Chloroflexota bacterium]
MTSPAHQQYLRIKRRYPDAIVLFRLGDFYEMFGEDAKLGAEALQITLTSREFAKGDRVPMAGIPHHALQGYLKRFIDRGHRVAVCEQLSEAGKGLVERDVVRVITPGTLADPELLEDRRNNYLAAVCPWADGYGLAFVDVTTGEFCATEISGPDALVDLEAELLRLSPAEVLAPRELPALEPYPATILETRDFQTDGAYDTLCRQFGVVSLDGFGAAALSAGIGAAGAIVNYVAQSNRALLSFLTGMRTYSTGSFMPLDVATRRNLELTEPNRPGGRSLLWLLDRTITPMGARLLRRRVGQPLVTISPLETRLDAVEDLVERPVARDQLKTHLRGTIDFERLTGRIRHGDALPRELLSLQRSLASIPKLLAFLDGVVSEELIDVQQKCEVPPELPDLIARSVADPDSGRMLRRGFSAELDDLVESIRDSRDWIAGLEATERERTGIKSLKVGYNKVFGYYLEVRNSNRSSVPPEYIRKQTLVNAERFITPDLKECEARILQADERIELLERRLYGELLEQIGRYAEKLLEIGEALARLDVYRSLAEAAGRHAYVRPKLDDSSSLRVIAGRHPVLDASLDETFIANDCNLDSAGQQIMLITGPNMGGKSTFLRQVGLIVLMAQIGSFVPAEEAQIGLVDRVFTRAGAQDNISVGQSTFMIEMAETANIIRHAGEKSLLLLDEIGRGTSTYDGLALARAITEYVHDRVGARTLFATHYHELTGLADQFPRIFNTNVAVLEEGSDVIFLHRLEPGSTDRSYGIHVGRLAGLPSALLDRAQDILIELETQPPRGRRSNPTQLPLFIEQADGLASKLRDEILALDVPGLTPLEALNKLAELQEKGQG